MVLGLVGAGQSEGNSESANANEISEDEQFDAETDEEKEETRQLMVTEDAPKSSKPPEDRVDSLQASDDMELD